MAPVGATQQQTVEAKMPHRMGTRADFRPQRPRHEARHRFRRRPRGTLQMAAEGKCDVASFARCFGLRIL